MTPSKSNLNLDAEHIVIGAVPCERECESAEETVTRVENARGVPCDLLIVAVPPGRWREVREAIWTALGTAPVVPENVGPHGAQDGDYIRRAYGSL